MDIKAELVKLRLRNNDFLTSIIVNDKVHEIVVDHLLKTKDAARIKDYVENILITKKYNAHLRYQFLKETNFYFFNKIVSFQTDGTPFVYDDRLITLLYEEKSFLQGPAGFVSFLMFLLYGSEEKVIGGNIADLAAYILNDFVPTTMLCQMIEENMIHHDVLGPLLTLMDN